MNKMNRREFLKSTMMVSAALAIPNAFLEDDALKKLQSYIFDIMMKYAYAYVDKEDDETLMRLYDEAFAYIKKYREDNCIYAIHVNYPQYVDNCLHLRIGYQPNPSFDGIKVFTMTLNIAKTL